MASALCTPCVHNLQARPLCENRKQSVIWLFRNKAFIFTPSDLGAMMTPKHAYRQRLRLPVSIPVLETGVLLLLAFASGLG